MTADVDFEREVLLRAAAFAAAQLGSERWMTLGAKTDERAMWALVLARVATPRAIGVALGIHRKRVHWLCEKWARRRIYNYGVSADLGWPEVFR